jgi:hypothetical protein
MARLNLEKKDFRYGRCPVCTTSWEGGIIPKDQRKKNNGRYKWSRLIDIEGHAWECPDCESNFDHRSGELLDE